MSIAPAILRAMQTAGCTTEQIIAVVEADAVLEEVKREKKRANNRERQRRWKAAHNESNADNALPALNGVNNAADALPPALDKETPHTPKEIKPTPLPPTIPDGMVPPVEPTLTVEHVMEAYNGLAVRLGLPIAEKLTKTRRRQAEARIRENPLEDWHRALDAIERSAFLRGENDRGWRVDFDFLLQPKSFTKLIEGAYDH